MRRPVAVLRQHFAGADDGMRLEVPRRPWTGWGACFNVERHHPTQPASAVDRRGEAEFSRHDTLFEEVVVVGRDVATEPVVIDELRVAAHPALHLMLDLLEDDQAEVEAVAEVMDQRAPGTAARREPFIAGNAGDLHDLRGPRDPVWPDVVLVERVVVGEPSQEGHFQQQQPFNGESTLCVPLIQLHDRAHSLLDGLRPRHKHREGHGLLLCW